MEFSWAPVSGVLTGQVLAGGRYHLAELIGSGTWPACGEVYRATRPGEPGSVAVRVLPANVVETDVEAVRRQAQLVTRLNHPSIARFVDSGISEEGQPYLVTDFVHGRTLAEALEQEGTLPRGRAVGIARRLLDALAAAHAIGVVHGELRAASVMLTPCDDGTERAVIVDFGISALRTGERDSVVSGQPTDVSAAAYLSPEGARGEPIGEPADVYAVGLLLYEMLCGQRPHRARSAQAQLNARRRGLVPAIPRRVARTALREAVGSALAASASDRPRAADLSERLQEALAKEGPKRSTTAPPAAIPLFIEPVPAPLAPPPAPQSRSLRWLPWLMMVIVLTAGLLWWFVVPSEQPDARWPERVVRKTPESPPVAPIRAARAPEPAVERRSPEFRAVAEASTRPRRGPASLTRTFPAALLFSQLPEFEGREALLSALGRLTNQPAAVAGAADLIGRPLDELTLRGWRPGPAAYLSYGQRPPGTRAWWIDSGSYSQPAQLSLEVVDGVVRVLYLRLYARADALETQLASIFGPPAVDVSDWKTEPDRRVLSFPARRYSPQAQARIALWSGPDLTIHVREFTNHAGVRWRALVVAETAALARWAEASGFPLP